MKKLFVIVIFALCSNVLKAQNTTPANEELDPQKVEALKVAFLSKKLELTPEDAEKFWPLYNQYSKEIKTVRTENEDVLERDEKVLNVRKKYKEQFSRILGPQRMNNMYNAENNFHKVLMKRLRNQNEMGGRPDRPMMHNRFR